MPSIKMTITAIRAMGLTCTYADGEYTVNFRRGPDHLAYYTDDAEDALYTARYGYSKMDANPLD